MRIGETNELTVSRFTDNGAYLIDADDNEVLLPNKYVPKGAEISDELEVFLYKDSEDRLIATTLHPFIKLNGFAYLKIKDVGMFGAFADWGLEKDLLIPFKEQRFRLEMDRFYLVCLCLDEATNRLYGTTKTMKHLQRCEVEYDPSEAIDVLICDATELGQKVIVDDRFDGMIYHSDILSPLKPGQRRKAYVYNTRPDGKLDLRMEPPGRARIEDSSGRILELLQRKGSLTIGDKSHPDVIREAVGMSKKTFKQAIGNLYKQRLIRIEKEKITLLKPKD